MGRWGGRDSPFGGKDGGPGSGPKSGGGSRSKLTEGEMQKHTSGSKWGSRGDPVQVGSYEGNLKKIAQSVAKNPTTNFKSVPQPKSYEGKLERIRQSVAAKKK